MPNMKLFADATLDTAALATQLSPLRDLLCDRLSVPPSAVQMALIPVTGLPDQPGINAELHILPRPDRTRETLGDLAAAIRDLLATTVTTQIAVRIAQLDAETYVALK